MAGTHVTAHTDSSCALSADFKPASFIVPTNKTYRSKVDLDLIECDCEVQKVKDC